jgi:hypothetical protein
MNGIYVFHKWSPYCLPLVVLTLYLHCLLPQTPLSLPSLSMSPARTWNGISYSETPQIVLPLREVSEPEGLIHVHVPFTINDI